MISPIEFAPTPAALAVPAAVPAVVTPGVISGSVPGDASAPAGAEGTAGGGMSFHEVLSALNPLQYLPVLGPIYRAITGDIIPEPLRVMGSMAASALMGGPIGVLVNVAGTMVQKLTGIDLDSIAHDVLASLGVIGEAAPTVSVAAARQAVPAAGNDASPARAVAALSAASSGPAPPGSAPQGPAPSGPNASPQESRHPATLLADVAGTGTIDAVARGLALAAYGRTVQAFGALGSG